MFTNGLGDWGSISGWVIPKTQKMVLDAALLNTQHYKVRIKGKVEQSGEWSGPSPLHLGAVAIEKGAFRSPSTKVASFTYLLKSGKSLTIFWYILACNIHILFCNQSSSSYGRYLLFLTIWVSDHLRGICVINFACYIQQCLQLNSRYQEHKL